MTESQQTGSNPYLVPLSIILASLIVSASILMVGNNLSTTTGLAVVGANNPQALAPQPTQPTQPTAAPAATTANFSGYVPRLVTGPESAEVVVVEFSDFQCPFCERAFSGAVAGIKTNYVATGKIQFAYEQFPLESIHPQARPAAEASECAAEQGKFWEYHDKLFQNQASLSDASYKKWAADLGLNTTQFNSCVDSKKYANNVSTGLSTGQSKGVTGTPTFFIYNKNNPTNAVKIVGAQSFETVKAAIDTALAS